MRLTLVEVGAEGESEAPDAGEGGEQLNGKWQGYRKEHCKYCNVKPGLINHLAIGVPP